MSEAILGLEKFIKIIYTYEESLSGSYSEDIIRIRKSYLDYFVSDRQFLLDYVRNNGEPIKFGEIDHIQSDWFKIAKITKQQNINYLTWDISPFNMGIPLGSFIRNCIAQHNNRLICALINMLSMPNDIFSLEPEIFLMVIDTNNDELINKFITMRGPISHRDYMGFYHLASKGRLDLMEQILNEYELNDAQKLHLIGNATVSAMYSNKVNVLEHYYTKDQFDRSYDYMFNFLVKSIESDCDIDIVKFFVGMGINPRQQHNKIIELACERGRVDILEYLSTLTSDVKLQECLALPQYNAIWRCS